MRCDVAENRSGVIIALRRAQQLDAPEQQHVVDGTEKLARSCGLYISIPQNRIVPPAALIRLKHQNKVAFVAIGGQSTVDTNPPPTLSQSFAHNVENYAFIRRIELPELFHFSAA